MPVVYLAPIVLKRYLCNMAIDKINVRNVVLFLMILGAAAFRLIRFEQFTWANFTPIGAMALFGGTYFKQKWKAYIMPLAIFVATDWIINYAYFHELVFFYEGAFFVYLSFVLMVLVGSLIQKVTVVNVIGASIISVVIHWLISDIGPWWYGSLYPRTFEGYITCLIAAIPYEKNLLIGNLVFGTILYGSFEWIQAKLPAARTA